MPHHSMRYHVTSYPRIVLCQTVLSHHATGNMAVTSSPRRMETARVSWQPLEATAANQNHLVAQTLDSISGACHSPASFATCGSQHVCKQVQPLQQQHPQRSMLLSATVQCKAVGGQKFRPYSVHNTVVVVVVVLYCLLVR